ncbi:MAG: tetratricopeptide repeat protein, partial [Planctomycetota bacterium]
ARARESDPAEAVRILEGSLEADPLDAKSRFALGRALERAGKAEEALLHYAALAGKAPVKGTAALSALREEAEKAQTGEVDLPSPEPSGATKDQGLQFPHFLVVHKSSVDFARALGRAAEVHLRRLGGALPLEMDWESLWQDRARLVVSPDRAAHRVLSPGGEWSEAHMYAITKEGGFVEHGVRLLASHTVLTGPILPHEIGHLLLYALTGYEKKVPLWLHEGFALRSEPPLRKPFMRRLVREAVEGGESHPFERFLDHARYPEKGVDIFYAQAFCVTEFLAERGRLIGVIASFRRGPRSPAVQARLAGYRDVDEFETMWIRYVKGE